MTIDTYTFPVDNTNTFYCGNQKKSGDQWAKDCLSLAQSISGQSEDNWLLYQDDFYQFSVYFFALLLADKNIVLAQGDQPERVKQAAEFADIYIGNFNTPNEEGAFVLPRFSSPSIINQEEKPFVSKNNKLTLNPHLTITLFTSGSSGEAKPIKKSWYQLANEVASLQQQFPLSDKNTHILATVTHKHIYGLLFKLLWPVFANKHIICEHIEYPEQLEHYYQHFNAITLVSSPSYLARTTEQFSTTAITKTQRIFCSGGVLNNEVASAFFDNHQQCITEIYGSTETGGIAWREQQKNPLWQLFSDHQVTLAQDNTLLLSSNFLPKNEVFKTDDRVELCGRLFSLQGRVDRIIKLHEKRLSLDELEKALNVLEKISASHCFMLEKDKTKSALVAVIQLKPFYEHLAVEQKKQLVTECKKALSLVFEPSLLPRKWRFVKQLPFNTQGKLVKQDLIALF